MRGGNTDATIVIVELKRDGVLVESGSA